MLLTDAGGFALSMLPNFRAGMAHLTASSLVLMGEEGELNGKPLKMVVMPVEATDAAIPGGRLQGISTQVLVTAEDWAVVSGALGQVLALPSGAKARIEKVTMQTGGGILLDLGPENRRGTEGW